MYLSTEQIYKTKQRQMILDYLSDTDGRHVTVSEINEYFKKCGMHIGAATVYRHLEKFVSEGIVRKYYVDGINGACFQYMGKCSGCDAHIHFKCLKCGKLECVECDRLGELKSHFSDEHGFRIDSVKTVFYGKCAECLKKEDNDNNK